MDQEFKPVSTGPETVAEEDMDRTIRETAKTFGDLSAFDGLRMTGAVLIVTADVGEDSSRQRTVMIGSVMDVANMLLNARDESPTFKRALLLALVH